MAFCTFLQLIETLTYEELKTIKKIKLGSPKLPSFTIGQIQNT